MKLVLNIPYKMFAGLVKMDKGFKFLIGLWIVVLIFSVLSGFVNWYTVLFIPLLEWLAKIV